MFENKKRYEKEVKKNFFGKKPEKKFEKRPEVNSFMKSITIYSRNVSKTTAGGRNRRIAFLVVSFDTKKKTIGIGLGKAINAFAASQQAIKRSQKNMSHINLLGNTISHNVFVKFGSVKLILKQCSKGSGVKAGKITASLLDLVGVENASCKLLSPTKDPYSITYALVKALKKQESLVDISKRCGKSPRDILKRKLNKTLIGDKNAR